MKKTVCSLIGAAALATSMLGGTTAWAAPKTLVYCMENSPENFNPQINTTGTSLDANIPVYNGLVQFEIGTTTVIPALAESWELSKDGTVLTFHLRKGVKFHSSKTFKPTRDFNADDVLFSFNRMWKTDHPYHAISGAKYDYFNDMGMPELLKSIEKVDDYTVRFTLSHAEAPILANMAMPFAYIMSAEYGDALLKAKTPEKIDHAPIGTGPFVFEVYQKDALIRYKAFDDYWGGRPKLDRLVFAITRDATVRYAKLKKGECQVMAYPNPADVAAMKKDPTLKVMEREGLNVAYLTLNTTKKPFDDKRVRQAINMAIDKQAIVDAVYQGMGVVAKNPIPPTMWSYNDAVKDYEYNPEKAKALLAEAGYPNGFETDLWASPVSRPYLPDGRKAAELMQADLAKVGIKANIVSYEWGEYRKRLQDGEHSMAQFGWSGDNGDPDNFLNVLLGCTAARKGGNNLSKWCNKDFDLLVTKAKEISDIKERTKLYEEAQLIFKDEAPWVTMAHSVTVAPMSKKVEGYKIDPFSLHPFEGVSLAD